MFVNMISVDMVEMAVVKIVNMAFMANSCVSAIRAMLMGHTSSPSRNNPNVIAVLHFNARCGHAFQHQIDSQLPPLSSWTRDNPNRIDVHAQTSFLYSGL
jgi:hypothetical protein